MIREVRIMEEDWDNLIILDACRYDYFSRLYRDYFHGKLKKVASLASSTLEWCKKSFQKRYDDVVYVSANPYINSKSELEGFGAKIHFHKVVDVWDSGWNERLGTVHPKEVNRALRMSIERYPSKRFIIHYLQPHGPYIGHGQHTEGFPRPNINRGQIIRGIQNDQHHDRKVATNTFQKGLEFISRLIGLGTPIAECVGFRVGNLEWKTREVLRLPPASPMDAMRRKVGVSGLQKAYLENLRFVLEFVVRLTDALQGSITISSDHGERLGERGRFSHGPGIRDPLLLEVPWLEVEKVGIRKGSYENMEKTRIRQEVRRLKASARI